MSKYWVDCLDNKIKMYKNCSMWNRIIVNVNGICIFSQTFPLENTSVHLSISSGETRRFERSIYPLSLSTRITTTGSVLPTRISLLIDLIRRRLNSLNNIIPVIRQRSTIDNNWRSDIAYYFDSYFSRWTDWTYLQYCCTPEDEHTLPYRQLILRSPSLHLQFLEIFARKNDTSTPYFINVILLEL